MTENRRRTVVRRTLNDIARNGFGTRTAKGVHWVVGTVAFLVMASYTSAQDPPMRVDAFAKAELLLLAADALLCLGLYLLCARTQLRKGKRGA